MAEKNKGGRPPRYQNEESVRIGALIRPRYKKILELISQDRQSTLSEALEYVVAKISSEYIVDGKPIIDYVRPKDELFNLVQKAVRIRVTGHEISERETIETKKVFEMLTLMPRKLLLPKDRYILSVIERFQNNVHIYFDINVLTDALEEAWKIGVKEEDIVKTISDVIESVK